MGNYSQLEHAVPQCLLVRGLLSHTRRRLHFRHSSGRERETTVTRRGPGEEEGTRVLVGTAANHGC